VAANIPVFVYGTLRKHEENSHLLEGAKCIAEQCWTFGALYDTGNGYPAMKDHDTTRVYGELYVVDEKQLHELDLLEDYLGPGQKNLYDRTRKTVFTDIGSHEAFVYTINRECEHMCKLLIGSGDWKLDRRFPSESPFLYFAYGSCMDDERFKACGVENYFKKIIGAGVLYGYELRFTRKVQDGGRADIVEEGGKVEGVVYEVPPEALSYLYRREGVKYKSYRPAFVDVTVDGTLMKNVLTFVVVDKEKETAPPKEYAEEIIRGASKFLSASYVKKLKKRFKESFGLLFE
jgi:gamma-glutamylcyclotransferase (GGCT)/AIG2-like uncharacterized protein YtfP